MLKRIKSIFTNENISHAGILVFSAATILNVKDYLIYTKHSLEYSWTLATALGIVLISMSFMLAASDKKSPTYKLKLFSTLLICLLSGTIQSLSYMHTGLHWGISLLFGYGFPIAAEMLLALSVAAHHNEMKTKRIEQTNEGIQEDVTHGLAKSFQSIDVNDKEYVEQKLKQVVRAQTDSIIAKLMPKDFKDEQSNALIELKEQSNAFNDFKDEQSNALIELKEQSNAFNDFKDEQSNALIELKEQSNALSNQIQSLLIFVKQQADLLQEIKGTDIGQSKEPIQVDDKYSIFLHHLETEYNNEVDTIDKNQMALTLDVSKQSVYNYVKKYKSQKC